ncbi:E3.1.11.2 [Mytilus edulis]|uniref:E3.1.11.2 n=1 Tax=Mytilus edulis TaxID=6550 RepID=A0A8S3RFJ5_MYTED|nr:E3.1.11.2 [Mytilus edulis]
MGNFIILDITIQDYRKTLAAIYGPNNDDPVFFENIKHKISHYGNSSIVVAGDWNVVQDYEMDTLHYRSENNPQSKAKIHEVMHELDLLDIWRQQHPFDNRYSWWGPNHKQSRLDYFMITSDIEAFVVSSDIGISYRSDHSPVLINLSLLRETEFIDKVKGDIKTVIEEYESDPSMDIETDDKQFNISYQLLWDMIKMKVLGSAISFSSFQKKEGNKKEKELLYKISLLDEKLLENNLPSVYQERERIELELKILREKNVKGIITRAKARWQVEGEKGSNYFCNLEKKNITQKKIFLNLFWRTKLR